MSSKLFFDATSKNIVFQYPLGETSQKKEDLKTRGCPLALHSQPHVFRTLIFVLKNWKLSS